MNLNIKSDSRIEILIENYNSLIKEEVVYDLENTLNKTYEYDIIDYDTCNRKIEIIENNTKNSCFKTDIETNFFISVIFASEMSEQGNKKPYSFTETDNLSLKKDFDHENNSFNFTKINQNVKNNFDNTDYLKFLSMEREELVECKNNDNDNSNSNENSNIVNFSDSLFILNKFALLKSSMLLIPNPSCYFPQYISNSNFILLMLYIFDYFNNSKKEIIMGYNSKGATSSLNHLHFQFFIPSLHNFKDYSGYKFESQCFMYNFYNLLRRLEEENNLENSEYIQAIDLKKQILLEKHTKNRTSLISLSYINNADNEVVNSLNYYCIEIDLNNMNKSAEMIFKITKSLNEANIPYNYLLLKNIFFIFPRKFDIYFKYSIGIIELFGVYGCYSLEEYTNFNCKQFSETLFNMSIPKKTLLDLL